MNMSEALIEEKSLSQGWVNVLTRITAGRGYEMTPLLLSLSGFDESKKVRSVLDKALSDEGLDGVNTVAGTIFPLGIYQLSKNRSQFYEEYKAVIPRIRKVDKRNSRGTYFERGDEPTESSGARRMAQHFSGSPIPFRSGAAWLKPCRDTKPVLIQSEA